MLALVISVKFMHEHAFDSYLLPTRDVIYMM